MGHTKSASTNVNPVGGGNQDEFGRQVRVSRVDIVFGDDGTDVSIGTFPAGTVIEGIAVNTTTAFDSGTSDVVSVGIDTDTDSIVNDENIASAGVVDATLIAAGRYLASEDEIVAAYVSAGTAPTAGAATVLVKWLAPEGS